MPEILPHSENISALLPEQKNENEVVKPRRPMRPLSQMIHRTGTENAFAVGPEIAAFEHEGWNITKLTLGEPAGDIPEPATRAAIESLKQHETHYTPSQGILELRKELAGYMQATRKVPYAPEHIVLTPGGKPTIWSTIALTVDPGDEVLVPSPGYPIFESATTMLGAKAVPIPIREKNKFSMNVADVEKLITPRTKAIVINSPANPTGGVISSDDLGKIALLANKHDLWVLSDEAYARIVFADDMPQAEFKGNKFPVAPSISSFPGMAGRTIVLAAFSKTYNMTGCRMGWASTMNTELAQRMTQIAINLWSCLPMYNQRAALACLGEDQTQALHDLEDYRHKADIVFEGLNAIEGISMVKPQGAFYALVNVTGACKKLGLNGGEAFRKYLLTYDKDNKKGVAVLSRIHFGSKRPDETQEYIRIAFPGAETDLVEAIARIKQAVER